jgi:nucleotide-binding universal stress UspA family protein
MDDRPTLIWYDGTAGAKGAIAAAARLLAGRRAVVLDVGPLPIVVETHAAVGPGPAELDHLVFDEAMRRAEEGAGLAREAGLDAEARADVDSPAWQSIAEVANAIDAAVIVVGSRSPHGLRGLVDGSVAHDLEQHAGRPLLVVPEAGVV